MQKKLDQTQTVNTTIFYVIIASGSTEEYWKRQDAAQAIALVRYLF